MADKLHGALYVGKTRKRVWNLSVDRYGKKEDFQVVYEGKCVAWHVSLSGRNSLGNAASADSAQCVLQRSADGLSSEIWFG